jgi:hypothetical protein
MKDNGITDDDLITVYKASNDEGGNTNPPPDNTKSSSTTEPSSTTESSSSVSSTVSTILGFFANIMNESSSTLSIPGNSTLVSPQVNTNGLWNGIVVFKGITLNIAKIGKGLIALGAGLGFVSLYMDFREFQNDNMSGSRLGYHAAAWMVGFGGIPGAVANMSMYGAEVITDEVIAPAHKSFWQWCESLKNPSTWVQMSGY